MAKVTFEFDDIEENGEILLTANRKTWLLCCTI